MNTLILVRLENANIKVNYFSADEQQTNNDTLKMPLIIPSKIYIKYLEINP